MLGTFFFFFWFCIAISVVEMCVCVEASLFQITRLSTWFITASECLAVCGSCLWSMSVLTEWRSYLLSAWELSPNLWRPPSTFSACCVLVCARLPLLFPLHSLRLILLWGEGKICLECAALDSPNFDGALGYPVTLWSTWGLSCCYLSITLLLPDNGVK